MPVPPPPQAKKVFEGVLNTFYQWPQKLYDGSTETFECVVRADSVAVIPFLDAKTILFTKQEQPHSTQPFWDTPGGRVDPSETMEEAAHREFFEETGYRAKRLLPWRHRQYKGMTRFEETIYVATDLVLDPSERHIDGGEKIEVVRLDWDRLIEMCLRQQVRRAEVMLAILGMEFDPEQRAKLHTFLSPS